MHGVEKLPNFQIWVLHPPLSVVTFHNFSCYCGCDHCYSKPRCHLSSAVSGRCSVRQLETLGAQRAGLEDMLKEMKRKDDILPKLMTSTGSYDDLFKKEIAKFDHICEEIAQNIEAQEQLLLQIQAQNDEFFVIFNLEDYKECYIQLNFGVQYFTNLSLCRKITALREKVYKQIEAAISKFREIKDNINEGLKFSVTLQDAITNVKQQSTDFVMTRNIQCREMIEDVQRQVAGLSFQDNKNTGAFNNNYPSVGSQNQRSTTQTDPRPQTPYYQPVEQPPVPPYPHHPPSPYGGPAHHAPPPPYHIPPASTAPYPPQVHQQPPANHEYGQPAYPGWRGPYYNAQAQQPGSVPRPPYTIPSPYPPPHQSGYYKQQ